METSKASGLLFFMCPARSTTLTKKAERLMTAVPLRKASSCGVGEPELVVDEVGFQLESVVVKEFASDLDAWGL